MPFMPKSKAAISKAKLELELTKEVNQLAKQVQKLQNTELIKIYKHPGKLIWYSFLKGIMVGLGSVVGATVVVAILIYLLSKISFVPVIGDFVNEIVGQLEISQTETTTNP